MKQMKFISAMLFVVTLFSSCEEQTKSTNDTKLLSVNVKVLTPTKAEKKAFTEGDQIGMFIVGTSGQNYDDCTCSFNLQGVLTGSDWVLHQSVYLREERGTIFAYYPYNNALTDSLAIPIETVSQTDYMFAIPTVVDVKNPIATLKMKHALSLTKFTINKDGYTGVGKISGIVMRKIIKTGTLNCRTGVIQEGVRGNEAYSCDFTLSDDVPLTIGMISIPMTVTATQAIFTIDNVEYSYELAPSIWEQGKETTYTLTIKPETKTLLSVGSVSVVRWGAGGSYEGNLTNEGFDVGGEV